MNVHMQRAQLLIQQDRYELAEPELRLALAEDSNNSLAHTLLAVCLRHQERFEEATAEVRLAIAADPLEAGGYSELAMIMLDRNRLPEARSAIREALRLEPWESEHFGILAAIEARDNQWKACLTAAEQGLEQDPDDFSCSNLRSMALMSLGQRELAAEAAASVLQRTPNDPLAHANEGWRQLHLREPEKALLSFQESLRLNPESEYAQSGMIEAMKTRYAIYRWLFAFLLWTSQFSKNAQLLLVIGMVFGQRILVAITNAVPVLNPLTPVIILGYLLFIWATWSASALFDLILMSSSFGRHALPPHRKLQAKLIGGCLVLAAVFGMGFVLLPSGLSRPRELMTAALFLGMTFPLLTLFSQQSGLRKTVAMIWSLLLFSLIVTVNVGELMIPWELQALEAAAQSAINKETAVGLPETTAALSKFKSEVTALAVRQSRLWICCMYGIAASTWGGAILSYIPQKR